MESLCKAVRARIGSVLEKQGIRDFHLDCESGDLCRVRAGDVEINFCVDIRDQSVSSTMKYHNAGNYTETLDSRTISRFFPEISWNDGMGDLSEKIDREIDNIGEIFTGIKKWDLTPRDLAYYFWGYNRAYSDFRNSGLR